MENIKEYPFNVIEMIFGGHKDVSGDKDKLMEMLDKAFETLKTFPEDEIAEEFKAYELPLSKSVDVAVECFKTNKTVEELMMSSTYVGFDFEDTFKISIFVIPFTF